MKNSGLELSTEEPAAVSSLVMIDCLFQPSATVSFLERSVLLGQLLTNADINIWLIPPALGGR